MKLSRRSLLAASGVLPLLAAKAGAQSAPKRLVVFYTPNGTIGPEWKPRGTETSFTFGRILAPLDPFKSKLIVLSGVNMALADAGFGSHHTRGIGGLLTGRPILMGNFRSAGPPTAGWASGISLDQHVAQHLAKSPATSTRFRSLELGVRVVDAEVRGRISYLGANQPVPPMESPYDVYERIFAPLAPSMRPAGMADRLTAERRSVLDYVREELTAVERRVGTDDRAKLASHLEAVRDIERRLGGTGTTPAPVATGCQPPMVGARMDIAATDNMPAVGRLQMDLLAGALACDLTRVATIMWTHAESDQMYPFAMAPVRHHSTSHASDQDAPAQENLTRINVWFAQQFRYLLERLSSYSEGGRTVLDNTVVLWAIEVGKGNNHAHRDLPFLLAGSCGGALRTGRWVTYAGGQPHNNLLVSLANAVGLPDRSFGDPQHCTGPLPGLS